MAIRSVFISKPVYPFFEEVPVDMSWFGGFALSQKRKCQISLHENFLAQSPDKKVLEISSTGLMSLGSKLSAMNLSKRTKHGNTSVESAFQASKVYVDGAKTIGPFPEYMFLDGRECKKLVKEASKNLISRKYSFDDMVFYAPEHHVTQFYDFLYLNALLEPENQEAAEELLAGGYNAFSDLATKSLNCQARSAAIFVGLVQAGLIDQVRDYESYLKLFRTTESGRAVNSSAYENVRYLQLLKKIPSYLVVPCRISEDKVEKYYEEKCSKLTNKKDKNNYLDLVGM